mgnify:CR=1 FL=1
MFHGVGIERASEAKSRNKNVAVHQTTLSARLLRHIWLWECQLGCIYTRVLVVLRHQWRILNTVGFKRENIQIWHIALLLK